MPAVACPECDARISCPTGTWANTEVTCPSCCSTFLTPESNEFPPKPAPTQVVGGRSDYLDAENFTADPVVKKPRQPKLVISGPVTVMFILGAVGLAALAGSMLVYTTLKVQGRIADREERGGNPLGEGPKWVEPVRRDEPPTPVRAVGPGGPRDDAVNAARRRAPADAGAVAQAPVAGFAQPATGDEAWALLLGTWRLVEKPAVDPQDEPSLQNLVFGPDKSAVLTDNLFEHSRGKSPNYDDPYSVVSLKVTKSGVTLTLRQKATGDDETLALTFEGKDRIAVRVRPREAGPVYLFKFAKS